MGKKMVEDGDDDNACSMFLVIGSIKEIVEELPGCCWE